MPTHELHGWLCTTPVYEWRGRLFESPHLLGPWPLRKDGEPYKRAGDKWWEFIGPFLDLSDEEQRTYRVGGGCRRF